MVYQRFSGTIYATLVFQECTGARCETPRSCCLGLFLICHRAQCAGEPCRSSPGAGWCGGPRALPPRTSADANPFESSNPLLLPDTHTAKYAAQQNPGREERGNLIHPPKESARQTIHGTAPHCRQAKSTDLCAPGQLCWHRRSLGNVRRLKIEQMFVLKGLLQCSA